MKLLLSILLVLTASLSFGQQGNSSPAADLFAQGMINISSDQEMIDLEAEMRLHPNAQVVRLDRTSHRFFILTYDIATLTENELLSWFGAYSSNVSCVQIGVHGVDAVNPFPFTNCSN
ncbi:MAG: hypothetical protein QNK23_14935 [Crocinitomicaceae bacterium]|nr:hypothetical protein [Crocinitomicaceae bacterium]